MIGSRWFGWALAVLLGVTLLGCIGARTAEPPWISRYDNLHWTAAYAAGALLAGRGIALAAPGAARSAARWFFAALLLLTAGQLVWDLQDFADWLRFPGPSDLLFISVGPVLAGGLWTLGRAQLDAATWRLARLDAVTLLVAVLAATLALYLPRRGDTGMLQTAVMSGYAVGLMAVVCLAAILLLALRAALTWRALLLPAATLAFTWCWLEWNLRFLSGTLVDGAWLNLRFSVVALLLGLGALVFRIESVVDERRDRRCEAVLRLLPLAMVVLASAGILIATLLPGVHPAVLLSTELGGGAVVVMAVLRQTLMLRERDLLREAQAALRQREADFEAKVEERTRELAAARDAADAANQAKTRFLTNMSHEIRTPLNSVLGMAFLARRLASDAQQIDYLDKVQSSGQHLLALINDVLDMSKIESGQLELETVDFDLEALIRRVGDQMAPRAAGKGLDFVVDFDPALAAPLRGDPTRLQQVLLNLVGNALKFTEAGAVTLRARRLADAAATSVHFEVEDSGVGVSEATLATLFSAFRQADSSITRRYGGTGLGLAISRQLVELMGGEIGATSELGRGSRFWFTVRLGAAEGPVAASAPTAAARPAQLDGARLLLVEDNALNQIVATAMLEMFGAQLTIANNGREALERLAHQPFDAVLMDLQMPELDGVETTRRLRADPRFASLPVIAMTGNAWSEDRALCASVGMNDYVTKPVDPALLYAALSRWLPERAAAG